MRISLSTIDRRVRALNYHHLLYFWLTARDGTVAKASDRLGLSQPTVSAQIRRLEQVLGLALFERRGKRLVLTDHGRIAFAYAERIFAAGAELLEALSDTNAASRLSLAVGVADVVPKSIAHRLLMPALRIARPVHLTVREGTSRRLVSGLAAHDIDLVLTDAPVPATLRVRAYHHVLVECGVTLFAAPVLAQRLRRRFPRSLNGAPLLLPSAASSLRGSINAWLNSEMIEPEIVGEFDDSALIKAFGEAGVGAFAAPSLIERDIARRHRVRVVGRVSGATERYYAISLERRLTHPAVVAIRDAALASPSATR